MRPMAFEIAARHSRVVRFCGRHVLVSVCVLIAAMVAVLTLSAAQATGAGRDEGPCLWGASSVSAAEVDGKVIVSPAATSGCIPK